MGKGKGKPSDWAAKLPYKCIFLEFRNVRLGRVRFFTTQLSHKLPGSFELVYKYNQNPYPILTSRKSSNVYDFFF